ncbi:kelch-like protein 2 [Argopecten irradians]|uniref:kelch-like protein 2 n=1 Tax=Argopecten irradians TaxID=31199 RepID=UPI003714E60A
MDKDGDSDPALESGNSSQDLETKATSTLIRDDFSTSPQQDTNTEVSKILNVPIQKERLGVTIDEKESDKTYLDATLGGLNILKKEDALCDVNLVVDGVKIKCHKVILAIFSEYFRAMFTREMEETDQNEIQLTEFECKTIQKMITLMYEGYAGFTAADARELLEASIFFKVESLRHMCEKVLSLVLDVINVNVFWRTTKRFPECNILRKSCEDYMLLHFDTLPEKEICNLSKNEMVFLLSNKALKVSNEDKFFRPQ